jgi:hypothetical protein
MANIHTMDQYLSPLRYFLIITIAKLQIRSVVFAYWQTRLFVKPLINFFKVFYKICVFSSLPGHFILSLTFPRPYIFWSVHDSSTFCQNIRACLKSCSEMLCYENTYSKNSSVIPKKFSMYRLCIKSSIEVLKYNRILHTFLGKTGWSPMSDRTFMSFREWSAAQRAKRNKNFFHEWKITRAFPTTHISTYFFRKPTTFTIANS